jgi:LPS sulfotransferase NodH
MFHISGDIMRLFGEALVLHLKSMSMLKTAINWCRQAQTAVKQHSTAISSTSSKHGNNSTNDIDTMAERTKHLLQCCDNVLKWLGVQFTGVLSRSEQCNNQVKIYTCIYTYLS